MSVDFNIADVLKLPVKIFAAIALGTGLIIFLPSGAIEKLYLSSFRDSCGFVIGLAFIVSVSIVGVSAAIVLFQVLKSKRNLHKFNKNKGRLLRGLDNYQRAIVYDLYTKMNHTDELELNDGAVRVLEQNLIIGKAASQYAVEDLRNPCFPYLLQPWVVEYLSTNKELVEEFEKSAEIISVAKANNRKSAWNYWES